MSFQNNASALAKAMGTRGLFGFLYKGRYYLVYNHFDSYPEGLGRDLVYEIQHGQIGEWLELLTKLKVICDDDKTLPTQEDIEKLAPYTELDVSDCSTDDWYCLTHKCQGSFIRVLESGYLLSYLPRGEMERGLVGDIMIEYQYILDFDHNQFIVRSYDENEQVYNLDNLPLFA